jgi:YegS/Rv2252/BmrU family lipid kinase
MTTYTALVNPISGGGHALATWEPIGELLSAQGLDVRTELTRSQQHAVEAASSAAMRGDLVIAVGGDGLVRDVAAGVVPNDATMAIVPGGRGNDLARKLGIPSEATALAAMLVAAATRKIDVIEAAGHVVLGNVYVGIDSVANEAINNNRWLPGLLVYRLAPVGAIMRWKAGVFTLVEDGETRTLPLHSVVVANSGAYGHGLQIVPSAQLDDGMLDVLTVGDGPRSQVVKFINQAKIGAHLTNPRVTVTQAREVTISADRPIPVYADGDYLCELPVTVTVRPAALNLVLPA